VAARPRSAVTDKLAESLPEMPEMAVQK